MSQGQKLCSKFWNQQRSATGTWSQSNTFLEQISLIGASFSKVSAVIMILHKLGCIARLCLIIAMAKGLRLDFRFFCWNPCDYSMNKAIIAFCLAHRAHMCEMKQIKADIQCINLLKYNIFPCVLSFKTSLQLKHHKITANISNIKFNIFWNMILDFVCTQPAVHSTPSWFLKLICTKCTFVQPQFRRGPGGCKSLVGKYIES